MPEMAYWSLVPVFVSDTEAIVGTPVTASLKVTLKVSPTSIRPFLLPPPAFDEVTEIGTGGALSVGVLLAKATALQLPEGLKLTVKEPTEVSGVALFFGVIVSVAVKPLMLTAPRVPADGTLFSDHPVLQE